MNIGGLIELIVTWYEPELPVALAIVVVVVVTRSSDAKSDEYFVVERTFLRLELGKYVTQ